MRECVSEKEMAVLAMATAAAAAVVAMMIIMCVRFVASAYLLLTAPTPPRPSPPLTAPFDGGWGAKAQMSGTTACSNAGGWAERSAGASDDDGMWLGAQKQAMALLMCLVRQHSVSFSISLDCGGGGMVTWWYGVCVWCVYTQIHSVLK